VEQVKANIDSINIKAALNEFRLNMGDEKAAVAVAQAISEGKIMPGDEYGLSKSLIADWADNELGSYLDEETRKILVSDEYLESDGNLVKLRGKK
jgi:hypothetical protein